VAWLGEALLEVAFFEPALLGPAVLKVELVWLDLVVMCLVGDLVFFEGLGLMKIGMQKVLR
jgi:hypothetical protein